MWLQVVLNGYRYLQQLLPLLKFNRHHHVHLIHLHFRQFPAQFRPQSMHLQDQPVLQSEENRISEEQPSLGPVYAGRNDYFTGEVEGEYGYCEVAVEERGLFVDTAVVNFSVGGGHHVQIQVSRIRVVFAHMHRRVNLQQNGPAQQHQFQQ